MSEQLEELGKNEKLVNAFSEIVPLFINLYETLHGDTSINGMPRRIQLSSLVIRLLFQNPEQMKKISKAFFSDTDVSNFFGISAAAGTTSSDELLSNKDCCVLDNSGSGGTQQPITVVANIFLTAIDMCVLEKGRFDKQTIIANLYRAVADFKAFLQNVRIEEVHLIGFSGFTTEDGVKIGFGELNAFPLNNFQSSYFFGETNTIGFVIKETFCREKLFSGTSEQMHKFVEKNNIWVDANFFNNMHLLIRNVRLALVLTLSDEENAFPSFIAGDYLISPTGNLNNFIQRDTAVSRKHINSQLNQKFVNQLSIKYLTIIDSDLSSVEVAIKRLLSAICSRDNDDDALIDAVMCWENIIGSEAEVSFRTCASISKLLIKDNTKESEVYKDLKNIYNARSSLVHGNSSYKTDPNKTQQAIFYAICLINAILEDKPLLAMASSKRSEHIMLAE